MRSELMRLLNRFAQWSPAMVAALAIVGLLISLVFLVGSDVSDDLRGRADLSTAIATMFALFAAIVAITALVWVESSDYRAQQAVKADTAELRATLRSIMVKGALLTQSREEKTCLDFKSERDSINKFLTSTTAFGYWVWVEERGRATPEGTNEPWRVFFLRIASLLDACEPQGGTGMVRWAVEAEKLLVSLGRTDLNWIGSKMADLAGVLGTAEQSTTDTLISAVRAVYGQTTETTGGSMTEDPRWKFKHLKKKGVADPNVDMFVAVFDNDVEALKAALEAGADQSITDTQVLAAHEAELADFDPDEWS